MRIGVFDSGVGGLSVAQAIERAFPTFSVELVEDSKNLPYGTKTAEQLLALTLPLLRPLATRADVIVIACNTLTTNCIDALRRELPVPLIGMEPMVKPAAAETRSGIIAVCATPATLASKRYAELVDLYAKNVTVVEPDCARWALMIQDNAIDQAHVRDEIQDACERGADVIVLGCTHFHWIEALVQDAAAGRALIMQPEPAVIEQLRKVTATLLPQP